MEPQLSLAFTPLCPERDARAGALRTPAPSHALPLGGVNPGSRVRWLVGWALRERERTILYGWCRQDVAFVRRHMAPLQQWLSTNLHPSADTLRAFWKTLQVSLAIVMPGAGGKKKYREVEDIIKAL